jgi:ABC-2 type transport system ATP-binding protein
MNVIEVKDLCKSFPSFQLKNVNIVLEEGYIMGFIGRNGAGKTTTLKSILNLLNPDSGTINLCGLNMPKNETEIKNLIGYVAGGVDFYPEQKIKKITDITKIFYKEWDDERYRELCKRFEIDENKKFKQLSAGMKVKYSIAIALSHNAKLLILDEPTSGLDPAARDDLILIFQEFVEDGKHSILFSTHITSDLEKCADFITYIKGGEILASTDVETFEKSYLLVAGKKDDLTPELEGKVIGIHKHNLGFEGMIKADDKALVEGMEISVPSLEDIMIHLERRS